MVDPKNRKLAIMFRRKSKLFWGTVVAGTSAAAYYIWTEMEKRAKDETSVRIFPLLCFVLFSFSLLFSFFPSSLLFSSPFLPFQLTVLATFPFLQQERNRNTLMIDGKPNRSGIQHGMENLDETCASA